MTARVTQGPIRRTGVPANNALQRTHSRVTPLAEERKRRATRRAAERERSTDKGFRVKTLKVFRSGRVMRSPGTLSDAAPRRWRSRSDDLGGVPSSLAKAHFGASKLGTQISGPLRDDDGFSAGGVVTIETGGTSAYHPLGREGCWYARRRWSVSVRRQLGHGDAIDDPRVAGWAQNGVSGCGNRGEATLGGSATRSAREQGHQCCRTTPYSRPTARLQAVMVARSGRCAPWAADGGR